MIAEVSSGNSMPDLVSYLFGPGKHNEHINQHLVAGYADAVFTANDKLWKSEPGTQRHVHAEARELGWQVEFPRSRWQADVPRGYVWHCSLSIKAAEGQLTDAQWTQAAHHVIDALGFSGTDGKSPCRWIAVRHGPSKDGNDHIHLAVNLVREDGTKASTWNDYRKAGKACAQLEERFGLEPVAGRITGRSVPEPSRADREISAARGDPEPLRISLERTVRACAAAARSEAQFVALARTHGLLIRPRYADTGPTKVTGYAVADKNGRHAYSRLTKTTGPIWFGGGKLASDLSLPSLRRRWEIPGIDPHEARIETLAAWSAATALDIPPGTSPKPPANHALAIAENATAAVTADLLAAAATGFEPGSPGPLSQAARLMARAAQQHPAPALRPEIAAVIGDMASTFLSVTRAGSAPSPAAALTLVEEVSRLVDACAAKATATAIATDEARRASVLVHTTLNTLTKAANRQARTTLSVTTGESQRQDDGGTTMPELTHEEEFLSHLTAAGILSAKLLRAMLGQRAPATADIQVFKAARYTEQTSFDDHLRHELGEQRWAKYAADPARIVCAALITDGAKAGYDMRALLSKVTDQRRWEDDDRSPAQSIARVLAHRITKELDKPTFRRSPLLHLPRQAPNFERTNGGASPSTTTPTEPVPATPWDDRLRDLLGDQRWGQYATDNRRRDVAEQLTWAAAAGHEVDALLTKAVTSRDWEDDPISPSRRVGGVLHHRIQAAIASGEFKATGTCGELPPDIAQVVANATARNGSQAAAHHTSSTTEAPPPARNSRSKRDRERG
ncbi:MAG: hypothetical protein JO345_33010 [Streptosporangiaceae bacterium]|nr:hypothetical protein [Streptosporangiaceae bacterium]